jgi:hypothetical protein
MKAIISASSALRLPIVAPTVAIVAPCTIVVVLLGGAVAAPVMPLADVPLFRLRCRVESVSGPPARQRGASPTMLFQFAEYQIGESSQRSAQGQSWRNS